MLSGPVRWGFLVNGGRFWNATSSACWWQAVRTPARLLLYAECVKLIQDISVQFCAELSSFDFAWHHFLKFHPCRTTEESLFIIQYNVPRHIKDMIVLGGKKNPGYVKKFNSSVFISLGSAWNKEIIVWIDSLETKLYYYKYIQVSLYLTYLTLKHLSLLHLPMKRLCFPPRVACLSYFIIFVPPLLSWLVLSCVPPWSNHSHLA